MASLVKTKIIGQLRVIYFFASLALIGVVLVYGIALPLFILGRLFPAAERAANSVMSFGIRLLFKLQPGLKYEIQKHDRESSAGLYVSNHRSHLDAFFLLAAVPGIRICAKSALFKIPLLGFHMRMMKQISVAPGIDAYQKSMQEVKALLEKGERVHVFPELTRCEAGMKGVQAFSVLPFQMAHQIRAKIIPIAFSNSDLVWPKGTLTLKPETSIFVRFLPAIDSQSFAGSADLRDAVHGVISEAVLRP